MELSATACTGKGRLSLVFWGWLMLLVVLLSAFPAGGAPRTRLIGSAFDPATVSVALNPRISKAQASPAKVEKSKPSHEHIGSPPEVAALAPSISARQAAAEQSSETERRFQRLLPPRRAIRAHPTRTPPAA